MSTETQKTSTEDSEPQTAEEVPEGSENMPTDEPSKVTPSAVVHLLRQLVAQVPAQIDENGENLRDTLDSINMLSVGLSGLCTAAGVPAQIFAIHDAALLFKLGLLGPVDDPAMKEKIEALGSSTGSKAVVNFWYDNFKMLASDEGTESVKFYQLLREELHSKLNHAVETTEQAP